MTAELRPCAHHETMQDRLDQHEERLREKRDRILKLEMEAVHMQEKLDLVVRQTSDIKTSLDGLSSTKTWVMGGVAVIGVIYGLLVAHGPALLRMLGGPG